MDREVLSTSERLTKINTCIVPKEPHTDEIHQQISHSRDYQVMPRSWSNYRSKENDQ